MICMSCPSLQRRKYWPEVVCLHFPVSLMTCGSGDIFFRLTLMQMLAVAVPVFHHSTQNFSIYPHLPHKLMEMQSFVIRMILYLTYKLFGINCSFMIVFTASLIKRYVVSTLHSTSPVNTLLLFFSLFRKPLQDRFCVPRLFSINFKISVKDCNIKIR